MFGEDHCRKARSYCCGGPPAVGENDFDAVGGRARALAGMKERGCVLGRNGGTESWRGGVEMRASAGDALRLAPDGGPNERGDDDTGGSTTGGWLDGTVGMFGWLCGIIAVPGDARRSDDLFDVPTTAIGDGVRSEDGFVTSPGGMMLPSGDVMLIVEGSALLEDDGGAIAGVPCGCVLLDGTKPPRSRPEGGCESSPKRRVSGGGSEIPFESSCDGRGMPARGATEPGRGATETGRGAIEPGERDTGASCRESRPAGATDGGGWLVRWSSASARWRLPDGVGTGMPEGGIEPGPEIGAPARRDADGRTPLDSSSLIASICAVVFLSALSAVDTRGGSGAFGLRVGMARAPVGGRCWVAGRGSTRGTCFPPPS